MTAARVKLHEKRITVGVPAELLTRIEAAARAEYTPKVDWCRRALATAAAQVPTPTPTPRPLATAQSER